MQELNAVSTSIADNSNECGQMISNSNSEATNISATMEEMSASAEEMSATIAQLATACNSILEEVNALTGEIGSATDFVEDMKNHASDAKNMSESNKTNTLNEITDISTTLENAIEHSKTVAKITELADEILSICRRMGSCSGRNKTRSCRCERNIVVQ
jgi:methyl-accepting chemotaxis protein